MSDKSGYTKKSTDPDWLGREREEHYDADGAKVGETRFTDDWLGRRRQEHYDADGAKTGETRQGQDWLGRDRAEHYDNSGTSAGYSRNGSDWLGRPVQRHYDASGSHVGTSRPNTDWVGRRVKEHEGRSPKVSTVHPGPHYGASSGESFAPASQESTSVGTSDKLRRPWVRLLISAWFLFGAVRSCRNVLETPYGGDDIDVIIYGPIAFVAGVFFVVYAHECSSRPKST